MGAPQNYVSVSRRQLDVEDYIEDYIDIMRRHRSWIIAPTWAGLVVSVVIALFWPSTYESSAYLRITPQLVSEQMVPDAFNAAAAQRLQSLRSEVLSRGTLGTIITDKKLYPDIVHDYTLEDAVEQMRKDIVVQNDIQATGDQRFATSVLVSFAYPDRIKAKDVVTALAEAFVKANLESQAKVARSTTNFTGNRLKDAQETLDELTEKITKFREENQGKLPDQAATNGQQLSILQNQFAQANDRINSLELQKNQTQTALQGRIDILNLIMEAPDPTSTSQAVKNQKLITLDGLIRTQQMQIAGLKEKYSDEWPAVKEAQAQLKLLKEEQAREEALQADEAASGTQEKQAQAQAQKKMVDIERAARLKVAQNEIENVKTQIQNNDRQIQQITKDKAEIGRKIEALQAKIDASPVIEQQYATLTRDLGLAQESYNKAKRDEEVSQAAAELQNTGSAQNLQLQDPANLPMKPSKPNRWAIAAGGIIAGLVLGLMLAGAKEAKDTSLKNLKDVRAYANLPVLSSIPLLENALLVRRKRRLLWLGWTTAVMVGLCAMGVAAWYFYLGSK